VASLFVCTFSTSFPFSRLTHGAGGMAVTSTTTDSCEENGKAKSMEYVVSSRRACLVDDSFCLYVAYVHTITGLVNVLSTGYVEYVLFVL
jgi:hypothetical protein